MSRLVFALGLAASCLAACHMGGVTGSSSGQPASGPLIAPMSVDLSGPTAQAGATVTSAGATPVATVDFVGNASTVAAVGDPVEPGLWMQTPLVTSPARARVTVASTGVSTILELRPSEAGADAGGQLSLEAMRALNLSFTDLAQVEISAPL